MTDLPPAGFQPFGVTDGFIGLSGPYYWREDLAGQPEFGFQTDARHGNPNGVLHGGAVLTFLDTILGHAVVRGAQRPCATISLDSPIHWNGSTRGMDRWPHHHQEADPRLRLRRRRGFRRRQAAGHCHRDLPHLRGRDTVSSRVHARCRTPIAAFASHPKKGPPSGGPFDFVRRCAGCLPD